jgi:hypothetical protein
MERSWRTTSEFSTDLSFTELERPAASSTGIFSGASHVFFISGAIVNNGTGFDGQISGELCFNDD